MLGHVGVAVVLALALSASPGWAQLYRWVDGDGRVHYGDRPPAGAAHEAVDAANVDQNVIPSPIDRSAIDAARDRALKRTRALERAHQTVLEATAAYTQAQARQKQGVEPLPGERRGMVGGTSRLTPEYFERQRSLEREVTDARQRLDAAFAERNALR
jgi:hypothetical protein